MKVSHLLAEFDNRSHSKLRYVAVTVYCYCMRDNRDCKYVCVSVYAYIIFVCMHVCMCVCMSMYVYVCMYVSMYECVYVSMYVCLCMDGSHLI